MRGTGSSKKTKIDRTKTGGKKHSKRPTLLRHLKRKKATTRPKEKPALEVNPLLIELINGLGQKRKREGMVSGCAKESFWEQEGVFKGGALCGVVNNRGKTRMCGGLQIPIKNPAQNQTKQREERKRGLKKEFEEFTKIFSGEKGER